MCTSSIAPHTKQNGHSLRNETLALNHVTLNPLAFDAAIIDLDGTLLDTLGDFVSALNLMLDDLSLPHVDRLTVELMVGKGSEHLVNSVLIHIAGQYSGAASTLNSKADAPAAKLFEKAFESYQRHYLAINGMHASVYPGVLEGLRQMRHAGLKLACLTNKPLTFAKALLKLKELDGFFSHVFGGDSFERKKPDPLPVLRTCEALGTLPARTLMVGDSANDSGAASAAGCPVILVTYGYNHGQPVRGVNADGFVDSLSLIHLET